MLNLEFCLELQVFVRLTGVALSRGNSMHIHPEKEKAELTPSPPKEAMELENTGPGERPAAPDKNLSSSHISSKS